MKQPVFVDGLARAESLPDKSIRARFRACSGPPSVAGRAAAVRLTRPDLAELLGALPADSMTIDEYHAIRAACRYLRRDET